MMDFLQSNNVKVQFPSNLVMFVNFDMFSVKTNWNCLMHFQEMMRSCLRDIMHKKFTFLMNGHDSSIQIKRLKRDTVFYLRRWSTGD